MNKVPDECVVFTGHVAWGLPIYSLSKSEECKNNYETAESHWGS
jgi:hypothetical protein